MGLAFREGPNSLPCGAKGLGKAGTPQLAPSAANLSLTQKGQCGVTSQQPGETAFDQELLGLHLLRPYNYT